MNPDALRAVSWHAALSQTQILLYTRSHIPNKLNQRQKENQELDITVKNAIISMREFVLTFSYTDAPTRFTIRVPKLELPNATVTKANNEKNLLLTTRPLLLVTSRPPMIWTAVVIAPYGSRYRVVERRTAERL